MRLVGELPTIPGIHQPLGGVSQRRGFLPERGGDDEMKGIAAILDQRDDSELVGQAVEVGGEGLAAPAHRQNEGVATPADRLGGPVHREIFLGVIGGAIPYVGQQESVPFRRSNIPVIAVPSISWSISSVV